MNTNVNPQLIESGPEYQETGLAHRFLMPDGPGPYPTVVLVHGRYGNDEVMWVFRRVIPRPWLLVTPRAFVPEQNGSYSWLHQPAGYWPRLEEFDQAALALTRFLTALPRIYNADPERLFLMGFSQGAAVAISTALHEPGLIKGIASLVGFAPEANPDDVTGRLAGMPVFMAAGTEDTRVPIDQARQSAALLRLAGSALDYHEYTAEHKLPPEGMKDLQSWWLNRA